VRIAIVSAAVAGAVAVAVAVVVLGAGCGGAAPSPMPLQAHGTAAPARHVHLASLRRARCYEACPVYRLTVYRDGVVEYEGEAFVKVKGKVTGKLSPEELTALEELFRKHGYLQLADAYRYPGRNDAAFVYTAYTPEGGTRKDVAHYLGDPNAPQRLLELEADFDAVVGIERWIGTEEERARLLGR
jgi:Domain of unknown function (DUF6438)